MRTLQLFNAVLKKDSEKEPFISTDGFVIESGALWAKNHIIKYYSKEKLKGNDLNRTFHISWQKIKNTTRTNLLLEQIRHYISTYGSGFQDEIYIPEEILNVPETNLIFKVFKAYSEEEMTEKCLSLLGSGVALKEETEDDLIAVLGEDLGYKFTGKENIRNKEAVVKIADRYNVYPDNPVEFFRYVIYKTTGSSLLIKNEELIDAVKKSRYNPGHLFKNFGLERLAEIFNRFKPLFLAYKKRTPKTINKISKLSKTYHKPLISNPLNEATHSLLQEEDLPWLDSATPFVLFKALSACYVRMYGQNTFVYKIRNGKSWVKTGKAGNMSERNYDFILNYMKSRYDLSGKKFYFPRDVEFGLPSSEKMLVGNIPAGTKFSGEKLAVGIYWEDRWGVHDLELSSLDILGKTGWNADYNRYDACLMYSGDITSASDGAVKYLYADKGLFKPLLIMNNVYSGSPDCGYKIIIGKGDGISREYMMNPDCLFAEVKCNAVQKQTVLGMLLPKGGKQCFVLLNLGARQSHISGNPEIAVMAINVLYQQWYEPMSFNMLVTELGAEITSEKENADFDFSLENLEKDSFVKIFK